MEPTSTTAGGSNSTSPVNTNPFLAGAAREAAAALESRRGSMQALNNGGVGVAGGTGGAATDTNRYSPPSRPPPLKKLAPSMPNVVALGGGPGGGNAVTGGGLASNPFIAQDAAAQKGRSDVPSTAVGGGGNGGGAAARSGVKDIARAFDVLSTGGAGATGTSSSADTRPAVPTGRNFPGWVTFEDGVSPSLASASSARSTPATPAPPSAFTQSPSITQLPPPPAATPARSVPVLAKPSGLQTPVIPQAVTTLPPQVSTSSLMPPPNTSSPLSKSPKGSPRRPPPPPPPSRSAASSPALPSADSNGDILNTMDSKTFERKRSLNRLPSDPFGDELDVGRSGGSSDDELMSDESERLSTGAKSTSFSLFGHRSHSQIGSQSNLGSIPSLVGAGRFTPVVPSRPLKPHSLTTETPPSVAPIPAAKTSVQSIPPPIPPSKSPMLHSPSQTFPASHSLQPPPIPERPHNRSTNPFLDLPQSPPQPSLLSSYSQPSLVSGSAALERKPPLPPRPITPDANDILGVIPRRPSANAQIIQDTLKQQTQPPPIPSRPALHPEDNSTIPPMLHDEFIPLSDTRLATLRSKERIFTPDLGNVNRRPPHAEGLSNTELYHKGSLRCFCVSGYYVVTSSGSSTIRVWYTPSGENMRTMSAEEGSSSSSAKVYAMAFVPNRYLEEEGRLIWVSVEKGEVLEMDIMSGVLTDRRVVHSGTVTHIMKYKTQLWTLDENGGLKIWSPGGEDAGTAGTGVISLKSRPKSLRISARCTVACVAFERLWTSTGTRTIEVYSPGEESGPGFQRRFDAGVNCGGVMSFAEDRGRGVVLSGHDDGKIVVWDGERVGVKRRVVNVGVYRVTSLCCVGGKVWGGFSTGKCYVYDVGDEGMGRGVGNGSGTVGAAGAGKLVDIDDGYGSVGNMSGHGKEGSSSSAHSVEGVDRDNPPWVVVKEFVVCAGAVESLVIDERSVCLRGRMQVASLGGDGVIKLWDGFLTRDWSDAQLRARESEYATYDSLKILVGSWNLDSVKPAELEDADSIGTIATADDFQFLGKWMATVEDPDVIVIGFQELVDLESSKVNAKQLLKVKKTKSKHTSASTATDHRVKLWQDRLIRAVREFKPGVAYRILQSVQLMGLYQCVFVKDEGIGARLTNVRSSKVKTGLKGYHGNKGGIATRFIIDDTSFCFVNCHLAAHQKEVSARNNDAATILRDAKFDVGMYEHMFVNGGDGSMILDHENVVWSGDLNYRLDLPREQVIQLIEQQKWPALWDYDQLLHQMSTNPSFGLRGFKEGPLNFAPTFKYDPGTDRYDTSEKRRIPAWCDRILYRGSVALHSYTRFEAKISDHRPIAASVTARIKRVDPTACARVKAEVEREGEKWFGEKVWNMKEGWLMDVTGAERSVVRRELADVVREREAAASGVGGGAVGVVGAGVPGELRLARDRIEAKFR
ncbi:hypothetical protein HDV00_001355 [Rhizophlyctis rosea]|nr:hypothetical protein HDV00_001355 [Rhizophlyctis rosea]